MDQGIENLLLVALGLVFVGAVGLWGLARALALLTSVSITSFAKQGAWQATVQQYAVFVKRLADEFFGSGAAIGRGVCVQHTRSRFSPQPIGPLKVTLEHILLFAILIALVGIWRASSPSKPAKAASKAAPKASTQPKQDD